MTGDELPMITTCVVNIS